MRRVSVSALVIGLGGASGMSFASAAVPKQESAFKQLSVKLKAIANLGRLSALAEWDQLVMMPDSESASDDRGDMLATLAAVIHERSTEAELGALIARAEAEALADERDLANVRLARRDFDMMTKIPAELAERKAKLASSAYASWAKARPANDFKSFSPMLAECFAVAAEVARYTRTDEAELYDVALNEFESGMTAARCEVLFAEVQAVLKPLIAKVLASPHQPSGAALSGSFGTEAQVALNTQIVRDLGFEQGRIDVSVHPFTTSFSPADVRITSRFRADEWYQGLAGSIHEAGHAMYESALGRTGMPVDTALSMGVHESQSLFWERHVGLSRAFWKYAGGKMRTGLGLTASDEELYGATNAVSQSLIRVEADELTYPMHVVMRFELERALLRGEMKVEELPARWNARMKELLAVDVPDDRRGCLQDVHWSGLAIGYFPTYLLGAIMAAQLEHHMRLQMPDLDAKIEAGDFAPIRHWLNEKVHAQGSVPKSMDELLVRAVGEPLKTEYFLKYLKDKYTDLYHLD